MQLCLTSARRLRTSYMWRGERLMRVPASRADVFRDRALTPADKRALMRFIAAAQAPAQGPGDLLVRCLIRLPVPSAPCLLRSGACRTAARVLPKHVGGLCGRRAWMSLR